METITFKINGMTCTGCVANVRRVLQGLAGVNVVGVSLDPAQATVQYDTAIADAGRIRAAIEDAGYEIA